MGEQVISALLQELINGKSEGDKLILYRALGDTLYGGVRLGGKYAYGIFSVCNLDMFIENDNLIHKVYKYLDELGRGEDFQIMFIDTGSDTATKFECARPFHDKHSFIEHPEARLIHDILHDKKKKDGDSISSWSIVVRFRNGLYDDDGNHVLIGEKNCESVEYINNVYIPELVGYGDSRYVKLFSEAIEDSNHCDEFKADCEFEDLEVSIVVKGEKCQALFRRFECDGNNGG